MTKADLSEADLREGAIAETDARGYLLYRKPETEFGRVIGCGASFANANLEGSDLTGADLSKADFSNAVLTDVNMTLTTMMETNLDDVLTDEPVSYTHLTLPTICSV